MFNPIRNIYNNKIDEYIHRKFVRFSLGNFEREKIIIRIGKKDIKINAGFEYVDVFFRIMSELVKENISINGVIVTKKDILNELNEFGIEPIKVTGKKYTIKTDLDTNKFKQFVEKFGNYFLLLNMKSGNYTISVKKSVPKPGKIVENFVKAKFDIKDLKTIKEEFLFDVDIDLKKAKKIEIKQTYIIDELIVPDEYKNDFEKARIMAKRKGRIVREIDVDGNKIKKEIKMVV